MNAPFSKKLRFSDVVYAISTTPKSLRLWLQRDLVKIDTARPEGGGWIDYSFMDIAILALVRALVNFGVDVPTASRLANVIMRGFYPEVITPPRPEELSSLALSVSWTNQRLYIHPVDGDWHMQKVDLWQSDLGRKALAEPAPVYITVDVETVLNTAFARAIHSASDRAGEPTE